MSMSRIICAEVIAGLLFLLVAAPLLATGFVSTGDGGWEFQLPDNDHLAYCFIDPDTGWRVGKGGGIQKTASGGLSWAPQRSRTQNDLVSVDFVDSTNGWAVGDVGTIVRTTDGGATWQVQRTSTSSDLLRVYAIDATHAWALGQSGTVLATSDGGSTWVPQSLGVTTNLNGIAFADSDRGLIVGDGGLMLRTQDGGQTWTRISSGTTKSLRGVDFASSTVCYVVGDRSDDSTILKSTDFGDTWVSQAGSRIGQSSIYTSLFDVHCVDANTVWAVSRYYKAVAVRTTDGGAHWDYVSGDWGDIRGASFFGAQTACVGSEMLVFRTTDGGRTWSAGGQSCLGAINSTFFLDSDHGWLAGNGFTARTTDGGKTWTRATGFPTVTSSWEAIQFLDPMNGWLAAGRSDLTETAIHKTTDGGLTWTSTPVPVCGTAIHFIDANTGWMSGYGGQSPYYNGRILKSADGGATWTWQFTGPLEWGPKSICVQDANTVWVAGSNGPLVKTTDGGANWLQQPKPATAAQFVDATHGWILTSSGILRTTDGGATWASCTVPIPAGKLPRCFSFSDANNGWAYGARLIFHTSDGGVTWTRHDAGISDSGLTGVRCVSADIAWAFPGGGWGAVLHTSTGGKPGCVWAKCQQAGKAADFGHLVVTGKFSGFIYAEHPERNAAIRINITDPSVNVGDFIYVHGAVGSGQNGMVINASSIDAMCEDWGSIRPWGVTNRGVGGNTLDLLVRTTGCVEDTADGCVIIDDGCNCHVKVDTTMLATPPSRGAHVAVTGISSLQGSQRVILPRDDSDVQRYD